MTVKTSQVTDRRSLRFGRMADLVADVDSLGVDVVATGNWNPGQIVDHVTKVIVFSLDGFEVPKAPLPLRLIGSLIKNATLNKPMKPGVKLPGKFSFMLPGDVAWDDARRRLAEVVARFDGGERMTRPSPIFGELSHEQWIQLHCRHAEMHFSFLNCDPPGSP